MRKEPAAAAADPHGGSCRGPEDGLGAGDDEDRGRRGAAGAAGGHGLDEGDGYSFVAIKKKKLK